MSLGLHSLKQKNLILMNFTPVKPKQKFTQDVKNISSSLFAMAKELYECTHENGQNDREGAFRIAFKIRKDIIQLFSEFYDIDFSSRQTIFDQISIERNKQDQKWGIQNHEPLKWLAILHEETGEIAKAILENKFDEMEEEIIQSIAVLVAMLEHKRGIREKIKLMENQMGKFKEKSDVNLSNLIKALTIFLRYGDVSYPCNCEIDTFYIRVNPELVSTEDKEELNKLGFFVDEDFGDGFYSYAYGGC